MLMMTLANALLALASLQEATPQTPGPMIWKGALTSDDADAIQDTRLPKRDEKNAGAYAAGLRAQLQALETSVEVQRDFSQSEWKLRLLRAGACWSVDYAGKAEIAAEIAETRADWLERLGKHAEAVFAAWHPFVMPEETHATPYDRFIWSASNGSLAQLVNATDALPRMIELHKRFPFVESPTKGGDAIESVVLSAIDHGDPQTLKDFGTRCVPALEKALLEGPEELPSRLNPLQDPLAVLLAIDRRSAETLILSTIGKRGPAWTLRVLRALGSSGVTGASWVNSTDPWQPPRFDDPLTLQMIDALAAQPMSALGFFALITPLVSNDAISPAVESFLLGQTRATDPQILEQLRIMLDGRRCGPNKRALYEAFLDSSDPHLRQSSADALAYYPVGPATLRATQHTDPNVRSNALRAIVRHFQTVYGYSGGVPPEMREYAVPRTPAIEAALLKLAADPEPSVRSALIAVLQASREAPPAAVIDALLADKDPKVRQALVCDWSFDPKLQARVFERLADDQDPTVLARVAWGINSRSPRNRVGFLAEFQGYLPALSKFLTNATLIKENVSWGSLFGSAMMTAEGARTLFDSCVRGPHVTELVPILLREIRWSPNSPQDVPMYRTLGSPEMAEIFVLQCGSADPGRTQEIEQTIRRNIQGDLIEAGPFFALARDERLALDVRLRLFSTAAPKAEPKDGKAFLGLLRSIKPEQITGQDEGAKRLRNQIEAPFYNEGWPASGLVGFAAQVVADQEIGDMLALNVGSMALWRTHEKLDAANTSACIERWNRLRAQEKSWAGGILRQMDPQVDRRVLLIWHNEARSFEVSDDLLDAMATFQVDESIDLVRSYISASDLPSNWERLRPEAIHILTRRLDEVGADALLKAIAETGSPDIRKACFDGLEQIRKYQDEKQSWQMRKGGAAARQQAIADLLPMLSDKDAATRASAARSLATLQAIEHLPKIVALLKDKDAAVREAAQKALDVLNTPPAKKP